jgi:hypothetical protein
MHGHKMNRLIITFILTLLLLDNLAAQIKKDWSTLTIDKGCAINKTYCNSKLFIDSKGKTSFTPCGQKTKNVTIDSNLLAKLRKIKRGQAELWTNATSVDTTCGYLITLDDSKTDYVTFDVSPDWYDQDDIKDFILTLNAIFKKLE